MQEAYQRGTPGSSYENRYMQRPSQVSASSSFQDSSRGRSNSNLVTSRLNLISEPPYDPRSGSHARSLDSNYNSYLQSRQPALSSSYSRTPPSAKHLRPPSDPLTPRPPQSPEAYNAPQDPACMSARNILSPLNDNFGLFIAQTPPRDSLILAAPPSTPIPDDAKVTPLYLHSL